ncbi:MAG: hypothetical protein ACOY3Z_03470 [Thermodesulfobacteriota bacterium]
MQPAIGIASTDLPFAELLRAKLREWGLDVIPDSHEPADAMTAIQQGRLHVLLLDVRREGDQTLKRLAPFLNRPPNNPDIILINTQDGISASMEGMRLGAAEELTTPLDANALQQAVMAAVERQRARCRPKRSLRGMIEQAMAAVTFAQAGEFDTAMQMLESSRTDRNSDNNNSPND